MNSQGLIFDNYFLGGVQRLSRQQKVFVGINETQINSASFSSVMLGMQYNVAGSFFLIGRANTGIYDYSTETKFYNPDNVKLINGVSLGLGYNLNILPMEFTAMYSPEIGALYAHIKVGFLF